MAKGEFASLDEAIAKSKEELQLTKVGEDWYSAEALERLEKGIRQAERGEVITSEEVEAKFEAWFKETEARGRTEL